MSESIFFQGPWLDEMLDEMPRFLLFLVPGDQILALTEEKPPGAGNGQPTTVIENGGQTGKTKEVRDKEKGK